jgi:hypothetical protein
MISNGGGDAGLTLALCINYENKTKTFREAIRLVRTLLYKAWGAGTPKIPPI